MTQRLTLVLVQFYHNAYRSSCATWICGIAIVFYSLFFNYFRAAITMSRKSQNSRRSSPKEPSIEPKQKFEIFANLPFAVFREYTNVRSLIVDRYRLLQDGKNPTNFHIQIHTRDYYDKLSHVDKWDGLFKDLEFIGSESSEKYEKRDLMILNIFFFH